MFKETINKLLEAEVSRKDRVLTQVKAGRGGGRNAGFTEEVRRFAREQEERRAAEVRREVMTAAETRKPGAGKTVVREDGADIPVRAASDRNRISRRKAAQESGGASALSDMTDNKTNRANKVYSKKIHDEQHEATKNENLAAHLSDAETTVEGIALDVRNSQASELVSGALAKITAMLELPSDLSFDTRQLINFDQDSLEQFAEIFRVLELIGAMLDRAAVNGDPLNLPDMEISADDAALLSAELRIEKFHLQMGLSLIGAREIVSDIMAEKSDGEFCALGISQATDPADLGMSALDTARVFRALVESDLALAIEHFNMSMNTEAQTEAQVKHQPELPSADSREMREMYKSAALPAIDETAVPDAAKAGKTTVKAEIVIDDVDIPISISELTKGGVHGDRPIDDKNIVSKSAVDKVVPDKVVHDKVAHDKVVLDKIVDEKIVSDKTVNDKSAPAVSAGNKESVLTSVVSELVKENLPDDKNKSISGNKESVSVSAAPELAKDDLSGNKNPNDKNPDDKSGSGQPADKNAFSMSGSQAQQAAANIIGDSVQQTETVSVETVQIKASATVESVQKTVSVFSRFDNEAVIRQIIEKMQGAVRSGQGVHEVRMILRPESLGEVRMSIRVEGDAVIARMQVESTQVKAILESNMQSLKDSLEEQNLRTAMLSVDVRSDNNDPKQSQRGEMMEALRVHKFSQDGGTEDGFEELAVPAGSDTGRRFGSNSFEYFV